MNKENNSQTGNTIIAVSIIILLAVLLLIGLNTHSDNNSKASVTDDGDLVLDYSIDVSEENNESKATSELPDSLKEVLSRGGRSIESIDKEGICQLVTVSSNGTRATISLFEKEGDTWTEEESLTTTGFIGKDGAMASISEKTNGTPLGLFPIGLAFYQGSAPATGLDTFRITKGTYWVDDPNSKYYNQRVQGTKGKDWDSAEEMWKVEEYKCGFVINYNMPAKYNKGSAIFLHIYYEPTEGCIGLSEDMVLKYLARLKSSANPYILIV
ncbi:MAG: hypothetical protein E7241_02335 [Lachnospiraceae bacterium]|nr:hypothetical protein [Lachnospiraceae bacterium]